MNMDPQRIIKYKLNRQEALAYKLCFVWLELAQREFPNYKHIKMRKTGDPRKSIIWKHCYKLILSTKGLIEPKDYRLYILAQLRSLGSYSENGIHPLIEPHILTGKNSWKRWTIWKAKYDRKQKLEQKNSKDFQVDSFKLKCDLAATKRFLNNRIELTKEAFSKILQDRTLHTWVITGRVSPYFILLNPILKEMITNPTEVFNRDFQIYLIDDNVIEIYEEVFNTNKAC
jgi:hypothetical protein